MTFADAAELHPLTDLDEAWALSQNGPRLAAIRRGAERLHDRMESSPRVLSVRTLPQATLLYPTKYAFWGAAWNPAPFVVMTHRTLLVQFLQRGEPKNLLFNPTDVIASREAPYFKKTIERIGEFLAFEVLTKTFDPLETQLAALGIAPADIDYVAFDHFHTQDLRSLLGTQAGTHFARFPSATLLAPKVEWDAWDDLHPLQRAWFVADGKRDVRTQRVALTARDLELGDGLWLMRTPGHTAGNQTLFLNTDSGVWGSSENGTCADAWSPLASRIPGVAAHARALDVEVVLNANTPEWMADQYTSMILERTLASRVAHAPAFVQMFSSSEVTASVFAPGIRPTLVHGAIHAGSVVPRSSAPRPYTNGHARAVASALGARARPKEAAHRNPRATTGGLVGCAPRIAAVVLRCSLLGRPFSLRSCVARHFLCSGADPQRPSGAGVGFPTRKGGFA